jgi:hypothetical protein
VVGSAITPPSCATAGSGPSIISSTCMTRQWGDRQDRERTSSRGRVSTARPWPTCLRTSRSCSIARPVSARPGHRRGQGGGFRDAVHVRAASCRGSRRLTITAHLLDVSPPRRRVSLRFMVDLDAAIGYVVAHGTRWIAVSRGCAPASRRAGRARQGELGRRPKAGGRPSGAATWRRSMPPAPGSASSTTSARSNDRPRGGLSWLAATQRPDGMWEGDASWPGSPAVGGRGDERLTSPPMPRSGWWSAVRASRAQGAQGTEFDRYSTYSGIPGGRDNSEHAARIVGRRGRSRAALRLPDGWPSFRSPAGWFARCSTTSAGSTVGADRSPWRTGAGDVRGRHRRSTPRCGIGMSADSLLRAAVAGWRDPAQRRRRESDDGDQFNVHTTLRRSAPCGPFSRLAGASHHILRRRRSGRPIGPRACNFWVEIPISRRSRALTVGEAGQAFTSTAAASTWP